MKTARNELFITIELRHAQLCAMHSQGLNVWATPTTSGHIAHLYVGSRAAFQDDFVAARPSDFESGGMQFDGLW